MDISLKTETTVSEILAIVGKGLSLDQHERITAAVYAALKEVKDAS